MLRIAHPDGTAESFTYNALGQVLTHTDGKGQTTRLLRTARGLPSSRQDAKGQHIRYEYDNAIRLTALVNENNAVYQFAYDASDRLIEEKRIDNLTRRFSYNLGGHLTRVDETGYGDRAERPQRSTEFERDTIGRLLAKLNDDARQDYTYDEGDRLGSAFVLASPVVVIAGLVLGFAGGEAGAWAGGKLFGDGSNGQKLMAFGGALLGGGLGAKGGKWFDARYEIKVQGVGSNLANVKIQRRAVPTDESVKVPTHKVPYSPVTKAQRANLKTKLESRTLTRDEYKRLDWDRRFSNKRAKGVSRFWADERAKLKLGESGKRSWSPEQKADILANKTPKYNGESIQGHHKYNALDHPQLASDPKNIYPATRTEHFERWHGGNWRNDSFGEPVNFNYPEEF